MTSNEIVKQKSAEFARELSRISKVGAKQTREYQIDCSDLFEKYYNEDIRESEKFKSIFTDLQEIKGPTLYYFEILSSQSSKMIVEKLNNYSKTENSKAVPAIKKKFPESRILYVGKVKKNMWGRLIQHLGFYKVRQTQGLQLFHWAKDFPLIIKLTVMEFESEMADLMGVLEKELAVNLKPILGKHN